MANAKYDKGLQGIGDGNIAMLTDDIRLALVTSGYTFNQSHQFVSDLGANIVARLAAGLSGKSFTDGIFNSSAGTFLAVSGSAVAAVVMYKYNASDASARLIAYWDQGTGLALTPNGGDIVINPDSGTNKWFKL